MLKAATPLPAAVYPGATNPDNEAEHGLAPPILLQYWQVVLRWKWLIAGIVIAALTLSFVATLLATPQYTATSRIEISRAQKNVTNVEPSR